MDCLFCKIISGEIPSHKIYEDDNTVVIMDIANDVDGHMLAIPKKHVKNILDCDSESLKELSLTVTKVAKHCVNNCGFDGVNLLNASDESAGQSVPHFHIHVIPRRKNDGIDAWPQFHGARHAIEKNYRRLKTEKF